jgi:hypothetical protein
MNNSNWNPISTAPLDASWVEVKMADGRILRAHWASGGGEDQPRFEGWFVDAKTYFSGISDPVEWRPLQKCGHCLQEHGSESNCKCCKCGTALHPQFIHCVMWENKPNVMCPDCDKDHTTSPGRVELKIMESN